MTEATTPEKYFEVKNTYDKDGNILTLDRFGSTGNQIDDFNYSYYSGTNKLQSVTGSGTQYTYDANGNMTSDALNKNSIIKYDHRNLITELQHLKYILNDSITYYTYYSYDESGNRYAKTVYRYTGAGTPTDTPNEDIDGFHWVLDNTEIYSRDVSGREMAIYKNDTLQEYPIYGLDMIGKIKENELYFYIKDHLGSVRVVTDAEAGVINCQDYDPWGYILENRVYQYDESVFKFTSKERDEESFYDYFGARYYDSRIGRWGSIDPLLEEYLSNSPYSYALLNPVLFKDPNGRWIVEYDVENNKLRAVAEENDELIDLYLQLGLTEEEFEDRFGIQETIIAGETSFDITEYVLKNRNFSMDPTEMNCFSSCLTAIGLFDEEVIVRNTENGKGFSQDLVSTFGFTESNDINPGMMKTWVDKDNVTHHSAIYILRSQKGIEYYFGRPGPNSNLSIQTSERLNQLYPDFKNYILNYAK